MPDFTPFAEAWLMLDIEGTLRVRMTDPDSPERLLMLFRSNRNAGLIPVLFFAAAWFA